MAYGGTFLSVCKLGNNFKSLSGKLIVNRRNSLWSSRVSLYAHQYWLSTVLCFPLYICSAFVWMGKVTVQPTVQFAVVAELISIFQLFWHRYFSLFLKKKFIYCHKNRDYGWKALLSYHSLVFFNKFQEKNYVV